MSNLDKYLRKGNRVIVEKGEYVKDTGGNVFKVSDKMPTHDNTTIVGIETDKKTIKGKGGLELDNITQVVSSTTENRPKKHKNHKDEDESLKFFKDEANDFILNNFGLKGDVNRSVSPAGVMDEILEAKDRFVSKFNNKDYRTDTAQAANSLKANQASLEALPELEDVFDVVFAEQEAKRVPEEESDLMQVGGQQKGVLQPPNSDLVTTVKLNDGRIVPVSTIDGRYPDRADVLLQRDSVYVGKPNLLGNYQATRFYDSKLKKYLPKK